MLAYYIFTLIWRVYGEDHCMRSHLLIIQLLQISYIDHSLSGNSLCGVKTFICGTA